jgi:hypothetical protein
MFTETSEIKFYFQTHKKHCSCIAYIPQVSRILNKLALVKLLFIEPQGLQLIHIVFLHFCYAESCESVSSKLSHKHYQLKIIGTIKGRTAQLKFIQVVFNYHNYTLHVSALLLCHPEDRTGIVPKHLFFLLFCCQRTTE